MQGSVIIIDASPLNAILQKELFKSLGPDSLYNDYSVILKLIIEEQLSPTLVDRSALLHEFMDYGVDTETALNIMPNITLPISRVLNGIIDYSGKVWYDVEVDNRLNIYITKHIIPEDYSLSGHDLYNKENDFFNDYVPERLRR